MSEQLPRPEVEGRPRGEQELCRLAKLVEGMCNYFSTPSTLGKKSAWGLAIFGFIFITGTTAWLIGTICRHGDDFEASKYICGVAMGTVLVLLGRVIKPDA